jgi:hypothetical protein
MQHSSRCRPAWHHRIVTDRLDILLLLALPASGKSELRRYLDHLDPERALRDMALGPTAQLDDYPYVHLMRRVSQELRLLGEDPVFFLDDEAPWREPINWLTLIHLVNDDFDQMISGGGDPPTASSLLDRFDRARARSGAPEPFQTIGRRLRAALEQGISQDVDDLGPIPSADDGSTVIIEFARGGPDDVGLPLPHPLGYAPSIAALSDEIRNRASILYVWVEPEESRRRNQDRAISGRAGDASILYHGVPEAVMVRDYGTDDMGWLESQARLPGTIPIGSTDIAIQRFDNRRDRTSFLRADPADWSSAAVAALHHDLSSALLQLAQT